MRLVMDRLFEALTELDKEIAAQQRSSATIGALLILSRLECARRRVRQAQIVLAGAEDSPYYRSTETPQEPPVASAPPVAS